MENVLRDSYVYAYLRPEDDDHGESGTPYYIGEGVGDRINQRHNNRAIEVLLPPPHCRVKFAEGLTKEEALDLEEHFIAKYGRLCDGSGILENISIRGFSARGWKPTEEQKRVMSEARKGKNTGADHAKSMPVVVLEQDPETGRLIKEQYPSANQAALALEVSPSSILNVAAGKERHVGGRKVYFLDDYNSGLRLCDELPRPAHVVAMSPAGELFWTDNLMGFCKAREHQGLTQSAAANCVAGLIRTVKQWQFWEEQNWALLFLAGAIEPGPVVYKRGLDNATEAVAKKFCLRDPAGNLHHGSNLSKFCRDHRLPHSAISNLLGGISNSSRGWTRGNEPSPKTVIYVISPEGVEFLVEPTPNEFAKHHGLDGSSFSKMLRGKLNHTRGWRRKG